MTATIVSRKDIHNYLESLVSRVYDKNDTYNLDDYFKAEWELEPIDFTDYPQIKTETRKWIEKFFDEEDTDKNGHTIYRGFHGDNIKRWYLEKEKLGLYCHYGFYYAGCGWNDEEMLVYTFCEGDITLKMFNDRKEYETERDETEAFFMND